MSLDYAVREGLFLGARGEGNTLNLTLCNHTDDSTSIKPTLASLAPWRFNNEEPTAKDARQLEETTNQAEIPLAIPSVKATTL